MKLKFNLLLILITALGFLLRFYGLANNPPSLNWDEVSHGWNAYSILKTGTDEWGKFLPILNFRAYGDYPLPLNLYLTIPFIAIFGLNEFAIRFPHVLLGTFTILSSYYLVYGLTKNKKISLLTSILVAISPWFILPSRFVVQSNLSIFFLTTAVALLLNRQKNLLFTPLSFVLLLLTLFSYHTARIFTPIFVICLALIYRGKILDGLGNKVSLKVIVIAVSLLVISFIPISLINKEVSARSKWIFLIDQGAINNIIDLRSKSTLPPVLTRVIYNRPTYFLKSFSRNYLDYFSPKFLFLEGGTQYQFSVPKTGLFYKLLLPFFYIGFLFLLRKVVKGDKDYLVILAWLLLSPIPASITQERFAVIRSTTMLPLPALLASLGVFVSWNYFIRLAKKYGFLFLKNIVPVVFFIFLAGSLEGYMIRLFTNYRNNYSWAWQYGYKEVVDYTKTNYQNYDRVIVTKKYGEPHEFFLFFWPWQPGDYLNNSNLVRFGKSDWFWVDAFDKFYFMNDWDIPRTAEGKFKLESGSIIDTKGRVLLVTSPGNYPSSGWVNLKTVYFLDGKPAFEILEKND